MPNRDDIRALETALGHEFADPALLELALTHSSHAHEQDSAPGDNEQLEFLGDAVLGFVTSEALYRRFPGFHEGQLSKTRAHLVSARHLGKIANSLSLGTYVRLGKGEEKSGGRAKSAILVNALEALLAALYLDAGLEIARDFILARIVDPELARLGRATDAFPITDHKSALQELLQSSGRPQPNYVVVKEEGPEHKKTFTVEVRIEPGDKQPPYVTRAAGTTKKSAEQHAARLALEHLRGDESEGGVA